MSNKQFRTAFLLFTVFFIAVMFLPRLVTKGMFGDGLLYASMARNLAEGKGSWWAPFFSSGYWIENVKPIYYENPPLMLWVESFFFRLLGDHWWVEKLYSFLLLAFNCTLIYRIWELPLQQTVYKNRFGWLPLFLFYLMPAVIWGTSYNLMDSSLLAFCLLSLYCMLRALFLGKNLLLNTVLAGIFIFLGMLTKGPVALYPVAAPFLFALVWEPGKRLRGTMRSAMLLALAVGLFAGMLLFIPAAKDFFKSYWDQRLSAAIFGVRDDALRTGWSRLFIFRILGQELIPVSVLCLLVWGIARWKKVQSDVSQERRWMLFFLLLGLSGTMPMMASTRQTGMYLIPALPMFALAAGYFMLPFLNNWWFVDSASAGRRVLRLQQFSMLALAGTLIYCWTLFGTLGREQQLQRDLSALEQRIPVGEKIGVCQDLMRNFVIHTYLQRIQHLELTQDGKTVRFYLTNAACDADMQAFLKENGFGEQVFAGEMLRVYVKD